VICQDLLFFEARTASTPLARKKKKRREVVRKRNHYQDCKGLHQGFFVIEAFSDRKLPNAFIDDRMVQECLTILQTSLGLFKASRRMSFSEASRQFHICYNFICSIPGSFKSGAGKHVANRYCFLDSGGRYSSSEAAVCLERAQSVAEILHTARAEQRVQGAFRQNAKPA
jgi:hypothetical protein